MKALFISLYTLSAILICLNFVYDWRYLFSLSFALPFLTTGNFIAYLYREKQKNKNTPRKTDTKLLKTIILLLLVSV
ncbi:MAG: hypothetical protein ACK5MG_10280, partial [Bacteroidales bacterium]